VSSSILLTGTIQIVAGMIPLVKDYLISQGKPALGFLNPWVCGGDLALGFNYITSGSTRAALPTDSLPSRDRTPYDPPALRLFTFAVLLTQVFSRSLVLGPLTSNVCNTYLI